MRAVHKGPYFGSKTISEFISSLEHDDDVTSILVDGYVNRVTYTKNGTETSLLYELIEDI